jgi:hypothetical protein
MNKPAGLLIKALVDCRVRATDIRDLVLNDRVIQLTEAQFAALSALMLENGITYDSIIVLPY